MSHTFAHTQLHEKTNHSFNQLTIELVISSPLLPGKVSPVGRAKLHIPTLIHVSEWIHVSINNFLMNGLSFFAVSAMSCLR